jgi:hypothetical protein
MQTYPRFGIFPKRTFLAARAASQLSSIIAGLFPPSSRTHGTRFLAAACATNFPFSVEPVKTILSNLKVVINFATSVYPYIGL